jgi:DNA repair protein RadC
MKAAQGNAQKVREDRAIYRALRLLETRLREPGHSLSSPHAVRQFLAIRLGSEEREVFTALWLDTQNQLITADDLFVGTLTQTTVYPREVVRRGLILNAGSVIFAHNHPSGNPSPSRADLELTCNLMSALSLVEIRVHDHFVVAGIEAVSLAELGLLGLPDFPEVEIEAPKPKPKRAGSKKKQA